MPADRIHLVRHAEVNNPDGVLYGRLKNYFLTDLGLRMAEAAAADIKSLGRPVTALFCSPLERARQSAEPLQRTFGLTPIVDERVIEPYNVFEGKRISGGQLLIKPHLWFHLRKPSAPSWGEPYLSIVERMLAAIDDAYHSVASGDVVIVSHQLPIWMVHSSVKGLKLAHDPRQRRCALSSVTSFEMRDGKLVEVDYRDPAHELRKTAKDEGAV